MESWKQDVAYAVRVLWSAKKFSAVVIVTLALGLGANTAVFSVLNAVVLTPLPYDEPDRLVRVYHVYGDADGYMPAPAFRAFRDQSTTLDLAPVYTYNSESADLTDRAEPERVTVMLVGSDYFRVLGVRPLAGQPFARADERAGANLVVISERIWRDYLGSRADAIGQMLSINGVRQQVVAVIPDAFDDPLVPGVELWMPIDIQSAGRSTQWFNHFLSVVGRLRPGATLEQAQAELRTIARQIEPNYGTNTSDARRWARVTPLQVDTVGAAGSMLWMLLGAVGLLLTIACVNVAGLVLARGAARGQELAVRAALGCSRWRLARQMVIESLVLSLAGGAIGLVSARLVTRLLLAAAPESVARVAAATGSGGVVFVFGFIVALVAGLAFGLVPALQHARPNLERVLRDVGAWRERRPPSGAVPPGARRLPGRARLGAPDRRRPAAAQLSTVVERRSRPAACERAHFSSEPAGRPLRRAGTPRRFPRRLSGSAGRDSGRPSGRGGVAVTRHGHVSHVECRPCRQAAGCVRIGRSTGSRGPVLRCAGHPSVARSNVHAAGRRDAAAGRHQRPPGADALSKRRSGWPKVTVAGGEAEIIGVIADVAVGVRLTTPSIVYHLHRQFADNRNWGLTEVVSSDRPTGQLLEDIRRQLRAIDPALVLYQPRMLADVIGKGIAQERFALFVVAAYALLALTLAAVGIYGVLSYSVSLRQREMGIRLALGAQTGTVRTLVVREGGLLAIIGVVIGTGAALLATRAIGTLLFGVTAKDPLTFALAAVLLFVTALAASWIPARTATRIDPIRALRD